MQELCHQEGLGTQMIPARWREIPARWREKQEHCQCEAETWAKQVKCRLQRVTAVVMMHAHFVTLKIILDLKGLCAAANKTRICNLL